MKSAARFFDHGLHPMMVTVPLGAAPTAIVFDALYVWSAFPAWALAGFVATLVTFVGIVVASIPGTIDFLRIVPREGAVWRRATSHLALGWVVGGYYGAFVVARWVLPSEPAPWLAWVILGANALGFALMSLQGYWGGELVVRHRIGVHED